MVFTKWISNLVNISLSWILKLSNSKFNLNNYIEFSKNVRSKSGVFFILNIVKKKKKIVFFGI